jgi:hypothetical protein
MLNPSKKVKTRGTKNTHHCNPKKLKKQILDDFYYWIVSEDCFRHILIVTLHITCISIKLREGTQIEIFTQDGKTMMNIDSSFNFQEKLEQFNKHSKDHTCDNYFDYVEHIINSCV